VTNLASPSERRVTGESVSGRALSWNCMWVRERRIRDIEKLKR
jgi:hypothetical protein